MQKHRQLHGVHRGFRLKYLAGSLAIALAPLGAGIAIADSGVGVDTNLGNAMNPYAIGPVRERDPDGMGQEEHRRTPTGFLHAPPFFTHDVSESKSGWEYSGSIEAGVLGGDADEKAAWFRKYKDLDNGAYLSHFRIQADKQETAQFIEFLAGGVGYDDQYYGLRFGRYNDWKIKAFYNETPHVFTSSFRNIWNNSSHSYLALNSLVPGGTAATTTANIANEVLSTPYSDLDLKRKKGGVRFDMNLPCCEWKFFASFTSEKREGARPFAATWGFGQNHELPEPIDTTTNEFIAGVQWADSLSAFNATATLSTFRNDIDTLTFENPLATGGSPGQFDMHPDNEYLNLKAEYARNFPSFYNARFTGLVSGSRMKQNDSLIPSTTRPGLGVVGSSWDTLDSLSRTKAGAKIETQLVDLGFSIQPTNDLGLKAKYRYYDTDNKTNYWACNPLTGQWGRLINNFSPAVVTTPAYLAAGCDPEAVRALGVPPNNGKIPIRNIPWEHTQTNYTLSADYRISRANTLEASFEREEFERKYRERKDTWENRFKIGYVNRSLEQGTLRLSVEHARKRGSRYVSNPYVPFFSASLGPLPTTGALTGWLHVPSTMRKFDLADRNQTTVNARFNYALREDLDAGISLQAKDARYPDSGYGRTDHQKLNSVNLDINWMPTHETSLFGFYSYQNGRQEQVNTQTGTCTLPVGITTQDEVMAWLDACTEPGSTYFPLAKRWSDKHKDRNDTVGFGFSRDFGKLRFDLNHTWTKGRTEISYSYDPSLAGVNIVDPALLALVGKGFPDMEFRQSVTEANIVYPVNAQLALRLMLRFEEAKFKDWYYDGLSMNSVWNNQVYLDAGPKGYHATVVGAMIQYHF